ncbi:hypothetical protein R3P38DRAFT_2798484 [Favolaschia claudopus]|uniref:Uncharacterized protein n=1 Tax=Favolaschia claudopus TaxID=2862362 RepID=A0AAW0A1L0_9AGAR
MFRIDPKDRDECDALQHLQLLKVKSLLNELTGDCITQYRVSADLQKIFRKYIWGLLTLPNIKVYSGDLEIVLIFSEAAVSQACTVIVWCLNQSQVKESLDNDSDYRNIALLGQHIVDHASDQTLMLGFLMCLAVIRVSVAQNWKESEFRSNTNDQSQRYVKEGPEAFVYTLKEVYRDDCDQYGDPPAAKVKIEGDATAKYLKNLAARAPGIQRTQKRGGSKRKHGSKRNTDDDADTPADEETKGAGEPGAVHWRIIINK